MAMIAPPTASGKHAGKRRRPDSAPKVASANPLRDRALLEQATEDQVASLLKQPAGCVVTKMRFCLDVLHEQLGLRDFAVGQSERLTISTKRKALLGDKCPRVIEAPAAKPVPLPSLVDIALQLRSPSSSPGAGPSGDVESIRRRIDAELNAETVRTLVQRGIVVLPGILSRSQSAEVAVELACSGACGLWMKDKWHADRWTVLRESSGNGRGGAYATIRNPSPTLAAVNSALAAALRSQLGVGEVGQRALALRYGLDGINYAHQDQSACPYQALLLLSRPGVDFSGGELYCTDAAALHAIHSASSRSDSASIADPPLPITNEVQWSESGALAIFAANGQAGDGSRHWFHGMRQVRAGSAGEASCQRLAVALLQ